MNTTATIITPTTRLTERQAERFRGYAAKAPNAFLLRVIANNAHPEVRAIYAAERDERNRVFGLNL